MHIPAYIILTAANNEGRYIGRTIESVVSQTLLPAKWIIVSDASTDKTDEVVRQYCAKHPFIRFVRVESRGQRGVIRKVNALSVGLKQLHNEYYRFVANVDADVILARDYFSTLLQKFLDDPRLGIAGGLVYEESRGVLKQRRSNSVRSVAGAAQIIRRECFESIGGYQPLKYGGEDWCAEISARMNGWKVSPFPDLMIRHLRPTGGAQPTVPHRFREGKMDFSLGSHPAFEMLKCVRRISEPPLGIGALARLSGFLCCYVLREPRLAPKHVCDFLRNEQKDRLKLLFTKPTSA
jgi:glycosyltransferase involved in cell wall biosynthesis